MDELSCHRVAKRDIVKHETVIAKTTALMEVFAITAAQRLVENGAFAIKDRIIFLKNCKINNRTVSKFRNSPSRKYMIRVTFLLSLFALMNANEVGASDSSKFVIKGKYLNRDTGKLVLFYSDYNGAGVVDTTYVKDGLFEFHGTVNKCTDAILFTASEFREVDHSTNLNFYIEDGEMYLTIEKGKEQQFNLQGSKTQYEKQQWKKKNAVLLTVRNDIYRELDSLRQILKIKKDSSLLQLVSNNKEKITEIGNVLKQSDFAYIKENPESFYSGYLLQRYINSLSIDSLLIYYNKFAAVVQNSSVGRAIKKRLDEIILKEKNEQLIKSIENFYQFDLKDTLGGKLNLKKLKGKYLLIDFWASWCTPCVENIPKMKIIEEKYSSKIFQIVAVSLDENEASWKKAIQRFAPPGIHLTTPYAFNSMIALFYKVRSLPHYLLIDKDGIVIIDGTRKLSLNEVDLYLGKLISKE